MAQDYLLLQEKIFSEIESYCTQQHCNAYEVVEFTKDKEYHLRIADKKENLLKKNQIGVLHIYFKRGRTSFKIDGKGDYEKILESCRDYLISETELGNILHDNKCAVFCDVSRDDFNVFIDCLNQEDPFNVTRHGGTNIIEERVTVEGRYETRLTLSYYKSKKLCIQGLVTSLYIEIFRQATELFGAEDASDKGGFLQVISAPRQEIISQSLDDHFSDRSHFAGTHFEAMMSASLALLNSSIVLADYTSVSFGALRCLEGTIGKRLHEEVAFSGLKEVIGKRFCYQAQTNNHVLSSRYTNLNPKLKKALEDGYDFYKANRHTTFHVDHVNPLASVIYTNKDQALGVVEDCISHINEIIKYW